MKIETKYNPDEEVYFFTSPAIHNIFPKVEHGKIMFAEIKCGGDWTKITYTIECFGWGGFHSEDDVLEEHIFKSKKQAAEYLATNATKIVEANSR